MAQTSNEELIKTACDMINTKRSVQRIRGAKLIGKHALTALGEQLYAAFLRELKDARTWEVKSEMLKALGVINFTAATGEIEKIVARNLPQEVVTDSAACALAMLRRSHKNDKGEIIKAAKDGLLLRPHQRGNGTNGRSDDTLRG